MSYLKLINCFCFAFVVSGCTAVETETALAGATGTAAGAGIGALAGSMIENGDVLASAGLGAGIGLGVGLVGHYYYNKSQEESEIRTNNTIILNNYDTIMAGDEEIKRLRKDAQDGITEISFDNDISPENPYMGPTLGLP